VVDRFRSELKAGLRATASGWSEMEHIVGYVRRLLTKPQVKVELSEYQCSDEESSTVSRKTTEEIRAALRLNHITPRRASVTIVSRVIEGIAWEQAISVTVWLWFDRDGSPRRLDVDLESADKLLLAGVKAQVQHELEVIESWPPAPGTPRVSEGAGGQVNTFHGPVNVGSIGGQNSVTVGMQSNATEPDGSDSNSSSWWSRTWRDHTMAFIVAVVGAVLAAILVSLWGVNGWTIGAQRTELHIDAVSWASHDEFKASGTVKHLRDDDEVWTFSRQADGFSGVSPRGQCAVRGEVLSCPGTLGTIGEPGISYVITAAVLTRKSADEIRATPADQLVSYPDEDGIQKIDDPLAIDAIRTWRP
jgi:hypothetical protein